MNFTRFRKFGDDVIRESNFYYHLGRDILKESLRIYQERTAPQKISGAPTKNRLIQICGNGTTAITRAIRGSMERVTP